MIAKPQKADVARRTYSVPQAGEVLGIGRNASYEAAARGDIPTIKIGHRLVVPIARLNKMLGEEPMEIDVDVGSAPTNEPEAVVTEVPALETDVEPVP